MQRWSTVVWFAVSCSGTSPQQSSRPESPPVAAIDAAPAKPAGTAICGRRANEKVIARKSDHGYDASCDTRQTTWANVPHEHRTCSTDADCVVVLFNANCDQLPLAKSAASRNEYSEGPCSNPAQGMCAGAVPAAKCASGCCNLAGLDRWGTIDVAYPKQP